MINLNSKHNQSYIPKVKEKSKIKKKSDQVENDYNLTAK